MADKYNIQAAIFDLDGTVLSNEYVYGEVFNIVLKKLGVEPETDYPQVGGIGVEENWQLFIKNLNIKTEKTIKELTRETQKEYLKMLDEVELKEGFEDFIESLREVEIMTALATSNEWWIVDEVMHKFDIGKYFNEITTAEEALARKPDPELFLITARKLAVECEYCIVFEDSLAGIEAAKMAGMYSVGVARDEEHSQELAAADFVISDFTEISPDGIMKL